MRTSALFILLVSLTADAQGRFERFCSRSAQGRSDRGFPCDDGAFFEFAPQSGAGMPALACSTTPPTGSKGEVLTFPARGTVAECYSNDGQTLTQMTSTQPRVSSGDGTSWMGLWVDPAAINSLLQCRDFSNVAWTKTNMTCTRNQTGMRNDASGASRCTATSANATVCQSTVFAAATRTGSVHIKRAIGTGAVTLSRDAAAYSADIATRLSSTLWRRVVSQEVSGCAGGNCIIVQGDWPVDAGLGGMTSGVANPSLCIKLATSGDAVDLDFAQDEAGDVATSPIETAGSATPRNAEKPTFTHASFGTLAFSAVIQSAGVASKWVMWEDSGPIMQYAATTGNLPNCYWNGGSTGPVGGSWWQPYGAAVPVGCFGSTTASSVYIGPTGSGGPTAVTAASSTTLHVGTDSAGNGQIGGVVKGIKEDLTAALGLRTTAIPGSIAMVGDSITNGNTAVTGIQRPASFLGVATGKYTQSFGVPGVASATCLTNWRTYVKGRGYSTLVLLCGVNDLQVGTSAAATYANLSTIMDEARAEGMRVVPVGILPWNGFVNWSAPRQTETDALNVLLSGYATTYGLTFVSTASLGSGSPLTLLPGYDSGDFLHPNNAGSRALALLMSTAIP